MSQPAHGQLINLSFPNLTYDPGFCGNDSLQFKVVGTCNDSDLATINFTVGDPSPIAKCVDIMVAKDAPLTTVLILTGSDTCNDNLIFTVVPGTGPFPGTLGTINQIDANHSSVTYTRSSIFEGTDDFDFTVSNCGVTSPSAHVTINVVPGPTLTTTECREDRIFLSWTVPPAVEMAGILDEFQIFRCDSTSGNCIPTVLLATVSGTTRAFLDTSVVANKTFCYKIRFRHNDDCNFSTTYDSPFSDIDCNTICPPPPPPPCIIRPGFDSEFLVRNDDNEGVNNLLATLAFSINYFGTTHSSLFVNNNGNVTFGSDLATFTPSPLASQGIDIIAPFWADVDTREASSDVVRYGTGSVGGRNAFGVEWVDVGYFAIHSDKRLSVQLVLIDRSDVAAGDFDMEYNYCKVRWEAGDVSGGTGGFWEGPEPSPARAGFANAGGFSFEFVGSGTHGAFLDSNLTTGLIYHSFNGTDSGRYVFQFRTGVPLQTP